MEIERDDGYKIKLRENSWSVLGRKLGFTAHYPSIVSRHHLSIQLLDSNGGFKVSFEVIGRNPICIRQIRTGEIRVFRKNDSGDMFCGDMFCVLAKQPIWFELKKAIDDNPSSYVVPGFPQPFQNVDFHPSSFDPVKEFGFMEVGKEFEMYPKRMMKSIDKWEWFLLSHGGGGKRKAEEDGDGYESEKKMGNECVTKLSCCTRSKQRESTTKKKEYINADSEEDSLDGLLFDGRLSYEHGQSEDEFSEDEFSEDD